jgi:hypothetical protein
MRGELEPRSLTPPSLISSFAFFASAAIPALAQMISATVVS